MQRLDDGRTHSALVVGSHETGELTFVCVDPLEEFIYRLASVVRGGEVRLELFLRENTFATGVEATTARNAII